MDPLASSKTSLLVEKERERLLATYTRKKRIIFIFSSLLILLALIIGILITYLIYQQNLNSKQSLHPHLGIQQFCSVTWPESTCVYSLSSIIKPTPEADPNQIFILTLQFSFGRVLKVASMVSTARSNDPRNDSVYGNCSNLLRDSLSQLNSTLGVMYHNPDILTQTYGQRREMTVSITSAVEDVKSCFDDLEKVESTAVNESRGEVHDLELYMRYSRDFLLNCDYVLENFASALRMENDDNLRDLFFENIVGVCFYGSQYLVLVFLFCLVLRIY